MTVDTVSWFHSIPSMDSLIECEWCSLFLWSLLMEQNERNYFIPKTSIWKDIDSILWLSIFWRLSTFWLFALWFGNRSYLEFGGLWIDILSIFASSLSVHCTQNKVWFIVIDSMIQNAKYRVFSPWNVEWQWMDLFLETFMVQNASFSSFHWIWIEMTFFNVSKHGVSDHNIMDIL